MARQFKGFDSDAIREARLQRERETGRKYVPRVDARGRGTFKGPDGKYEKDIPDSAYNPKLPEDYGFEVKTGYGESSQGVDADNFFDIGDIGIGPDSPRPAPLTVRPTSSTNFQRPYTVAAGWERYPSQGRKTQDQELGTLTVMFRDGTLWNYYNVDRSFWITFRSAISKGQFINKHAQNPRLNSYPHGPADVSGVPASTQQYIQQTSREAQVLYRDRRVKKKTAPVAKGAQGRYSKRPRKR